MVTYKRICKVHKIVRNKHLIPCETIITKEGIEYCPKCKEEGTNYGIKTAIFTE